MKKKNIKRRILNSYCFCSGAKLWELGFKEGEFLHAFGCPLRRNKQEIEAHAKPLIELGRQGGLILGAASIGDDISPKTYDFYISLVKKYGNYY